MKFSKSEWAIIVCILCTLSMLVACVPAGARPPDVIKHSTTPSDVLIRLALTATWLAGIGLFGCAVAAIFTPNKWAVAKAALYLVAILGIAQSLYYIGNHPWILVLVVVGGIGCGLADWMFLHRKYLAKKIKLATTLVNK